MVPDTVVLCCKTRYLDISVIAAVGALWTLLKSLFC
jgi:hypothetical protein